MKKSIIAAVLATGLTVTSAHAAFIDESSSNPFSTHTQVRVIGSMQQEHVHGFAANVPLHEAIGQIVPRNYTVRTMGIERLSERQVSWRGNRSWIEVLRDVVEQVPSIKADIDTSAKLITFTLSETPATAGATPAAATQDSAAPSATPAPTWEIRHQDSTIRSVFERWARTAGWQLVWDTEVDYPVLADAVINGSFEEAVETVTRSMQQADTPPQSIFYRGNNVLRVIKRGSE